MWSAIGAGIDLVHAFAMTVWLLGLPLLFARRWPRARLLYAVYAVLFIVASQGSRLLMDECFLTVLAQWCWGHNPSHVVSSDWFTMRLARAIFGMAPSHHMISRLSEALVLATAAGVIVTVVRSRRDRGLPTSKA